MPSRFQGRSSRGTGDGGCDAKVARCVGQSQGGSSDFGRQLCFAGIPGRPCVAVPGAITSDLSAIQIAIQCALLQWARSNKGNDMYRT